MSQSCRAMAECIFGWGKQHGTMRKAKHRGIAAVAADFLLIDRLQSDPHPQTCRGVVHGRSKGPKLDPSPKLDPHLREQWLSF
jgi:hypothetical protein